MHCVAIAGVVVVAAAVVVAAGWIALCIPAVCLRVPVDACAGRVCLMLALDECVRCHDLSSVFAACATQLQQKQAAEEAHSTITEDEETLIIACEDNDAAEVDRLLSRGCVRARVRAVLCA